MNEALGSIPRTKKKKKAQSRYGKQDHHSYASFSNDYDKKQTDILKWHYSSNRWFKIINITKHSEWGHMKNRYQQLKDIRPKIKKMFASHYKKS